MTKTDIYDAAVIVLAFAGSGFWIWRMKWLGGYLVSFVVGAAAIGKYTNRMPIISVGIVAIYCLAGCWLGRQLFHNGREWTYARPRISSGRKKTE